jgi:uncharacterized protein (TIGR02265 family)
VDLRKEFLDEVCKHCDLTERLQLVPPSAKIRGLYFRSIEATLARAGKLSDYQKLFPERYMAVAWHPVGEFLVRLVSAGAMLEGPEKLHQGMFEIGRRNAVAFAESLLGRTLFRLLSRDPKRLLQQGVSGHRTSYTHGRWTLAFPEEGTAVMTMLDEFLYIESYLLGAAQGTFDAIGRQVCTEVVMEDRLNGRHILKW